MKAERVRTDALCDPGPAGHPPHDSPGAVTVETVAVGTEEDRSLAAFADGEVDRPRRAGSEGDRDDLAALAQDRESPMPSLQADRLDVGPGGLRDAQPFSRG
jgi:hypothetical protein